MNVSKRLSPSIFAALAISTLFLSSSMQLNAQNENSSPTFIDDTKIYESSNFGLKIHYPHNWEIIEKDFDSEDRVIDVVTFYSPLETFSDTYKDAFTITVDDIPYEADLKEYLQETLTSYAETYKDFRLIEATTNAKLAGRPAYSLVYTETLVDGENNETGQDLKSMEIGTIIDNRAYYVTYFALEEDYPSRLPIIQQMLGSLEITKSEPEKVSKIEEGYGDNVSLNAEDISGNFSLYTNSTYGVALNYPSRDWQVYEQDSSLLDSVTDIVQFNSPLKSVVDPYREYVSLSVDNLENRSVTLNQYLNETIEVYRSSYIGFNVINSSTQNTLTNNNNPAYELTFTATDPEGYIDLKVSETGTIVRDKVYYITYFSEAKRFPEYIPIVEEIVNSLRITNLPSVDEEQIAEQPKRVKYSLPEGDIQFLTLSYDEWRSDDLNIKILINPDTQEQSSKYIENIEAAVKKWSDALKQTSGNYDAWNFNINRTVGYLSSIESDRRTDITIAVTGDPEGVGCNEFIGIAPSHPYNLALPVVVNVLTSCLGENQEVIEFPIDIIYSTTLHEFAHSLGLGHAFNMNNDLMCSSETDPEGKDFDTCDYYTTDVTEISEVDVNALLYKYGRDGFKPPNRNLSGEIPYYEVGTPIDPVPTNNTRTNQAS